MTTIVEMIRDFIAKCPLLKDGELHVDYLPNHPVHYTIEDEPVNPIIKTYIDGSTQRQHDFVFASREAYGGDVWQNLENCGFYEKFSEWLEQQTRNRILPDMGEQKEALSLQALTTGFVFDTTANDARYQIQCRLIYYQE